MFNSKTKSVVSFEYNNNTDLISHRPVDFRLHKTGCNTCCCSLFSP